MINSSVPHPFFAMIYFYLFKILIPTKLNLYKEI